MKGQNQSGGGSGGDKKDDKDKKKKYEPPIPTRVGKKKRKAKGPDAALKLPQVTPHTRCRLKLLKLERIKDYLLMEEEFIRNQERLKPQEEKIEEERSKVSYQIHEKQFQSSLKAHNEATISHKNIFLQGYHGYV